MGATIQKDDTGNPILFLAKPVQGSQFALLALAKTSQNKLSAIGSTAGTGIVGSRIDEPRGEYHVKRHFEYQRDWPTGAANDGIVPVNDNCWCRDAGLALSNSSNISTC
jgi:hypothetical protein